MLVETKNLSKIYGEKVAVNGLDIQIERGSFTAILGPNGAGKSTTIQMLIGLLKPTSGQICYAEKLRLGVVFQNSVLDARLTVLENLTIRAKQYKEMPAGRIERLVSQLGLSAFVKQPYGTLSGGQKRRVDIARALLNDPDLILADEPTGNLDPETSVEIMKVMREINDSGRSILMATHDYALILKFPSKTIKCDAGKLFEVVQRSV